MRALMYAGIGLCGAGAAALIVGAVIDVDAADPWASVGGGAAGLVGIGLALYAHFALTPTRPSVSATGERSIAAGGSIGAATTGDGAAPTVSPAMPAATPPAPGGATAAGDRSVAAGGDIGTASTGDA
jgi:hypothetical protein